MTDLSSYLRYLPSIYARRPDAFIGAYLKIFEKILTGIGDGELDGRKGIQELLAADVIGNLFYPRLSFLFPTNTRDFIPPIDGKNKDALLAELETYIGAEPPADVLGGFLTNPMSNDPLTGITTWLEEFLAWLAGWVEVILDSGWSLDKKRVVIAQAMALYRLRGTPQGVNFLLNLLFDMPRMVTGRTADGMSASGQASLEVVNPTPPDIVVTNEFASRRSFVLESSVTTGMPVVSGFAYRLFIVRIVLPSASDSNFFITDFGWLRTLLRKLPIVLETVKPALTCWSLTIVPSMRLPPAGEPLTSPAQLSLGGNTLLGSQA